MKIKKNTLKELGQILKEEFNLTLNDKDLLRLATSLIGYFSLLRKIEGRNKNE